MCISLRLSWHASCRLTLVLRRVKTSLRVRARFSRSFEMLLFTSCCFSSKRNFRWIVLGNRKENTRRLYDLPERCSIATKQVVRSRAKYFWRLQNYDDIEIRSIRLLIRMACEITYLICVARETQANLVKKSISSIAVNNTQTLEVKRKWNPTRISPSIENI